MTSVLDHLKSARSALSNPVKHFRSFTGPKHALELYREIRLHNSGRGAEFREWSELKAALEHCVPAQRESLTKGIAAGFLADFEKAGLRAYLVLAPGSTIKGGSSGSPGAQRQTGVQQQFVVKEVLLQILMTLPDRWVEGKFVHPVRAVTLRSLVAKKDGSFRLKVHDDAAVPDDEFV